jgi:gas vesicle protein
MSNQQKGKDLLLGVVVGGVLGAVTALLLAPKSGKELRQDIAEQAQAVSEKTQQVAGTISQKTQQVAGAISQKTQEVTSTVGATTAELYDKAKTAAVNVVDGVRSWKEPKTDVIEEGDSSSEAAEDLVLLGER